MFVDIRNACSVNPGEPRPAAPLDRLATRRPSASTKGDRIVDPDVRHRHSFDIDLELAGQRAAASSLVSSASCSGYTGAAVGEGERFRNVS